MTKEIVELAAQIAHKIDSMEGYLYSVSITLEPFEFSLRYTSFINQGYYSFPIHSSDEQALIEQLRALWNFENGYFSGLWGMDYGITEIVKRHYRIKAIDDLLIEL